MSIQLFSGLPGAGKTLSLLERLVQFRAADSGRPVYAYGIAGLRDGLALPVDVKKEPIRNPKFGETDEPEFLPWWCQLPHGSLICIDEVQKVWPAARALGNLPLDISMLNEHRHWGYDFLLTTQTPSYLHKHVRGLVDEHTHVVRRWGGKTVDRYVWQEGQEDVKSRSIRAAGSRQRWKYPKKLYDLYQSSTMHTVKRRLPWQYFMMFACVILAPLVAWFAWKRVYGLRNLGHIASPQAAVAAPGATPVSYSSPSAEKTRWVTVEDYVKDHLPRVANQPWSAPVFDQEAIAAKPDLLCIEYHRVINGVDQQLCSCYTEQVTPYDLHSLEECRRYARNGVYNPRRPPVGGGDRFAREDEQQRPGRLQDAGTRSAAESPADSGAWQPAWRTRGYVQPERTAVTARVPGIPGGG